MNLCSVIFAKKSVSFAWFVFIYSLLTLALYHYPLAIYAFGHVNLDIQGIQILLSVAVAQTFATALIFGILGLIYTRLLFIFGVLFFIINSFAFYFFIFYGTMLDKSMIGNVFNTDSKEAMGLFSPMILVFVLFLGILPSLFILKLKIKPIRFIKKLLFVFLSFIFLLVFAYANSKTWGWFDKNSKYIGALSLPWSYVFNSIGVLNDKLAKKPRKLLPDLSLDSKKQIVVLVIGESARFDNFSLLGYKKNTNPLLKNEQILAQKAKSCATYTTAAIECMFSHNGSTAYETLPNYLHRYGVDVLWRSTNWGEPDLNATIYERRGEIKKLCQKNCPNLEYDNVLLYKLTDRINELKANKKFIVLHQAGSHGPAYFQKYPPKFEKFSPVCKNASVSKCTQEELINAYDNTIVYNDFFLKSLIDELKKFKVPTALIYISDHGESLGEYGLYLHGTPKQIAPSYQSNVPLIIWANSSFKKSHKYALDLKMYSQDYIFHSIIGAFGGKTEIYNKNLDFFAK